MKYAKTFGVWFAVAFLGVVVAQFAQIQSALNAGDYDAAKKLGVAALTAAVTAGVGSVLTHLTTLVGDPAANRQAK